MKQQGRIKMPAGDLKVGERDFTNTTGYVRRYLSVLTNSLSKHRCVCVLAESASYKSGKSPIMIFR